MAWDDFSDFVTHFTKATEHSEYNNMLSILGSGRLKAVNPFGIARTRAPAAVSQKTVCFSEVPLHCLARISARRSKHGIGFTKEFAKKNGALPVWYVEKDSTQHQTIERYISEARQASRPEQALIWTLTPFIDVPGTYPTGTYRFEWEREWRCASDFLFEVEDVAFLVIPEDLHVAACEFFRGARMDRLGPSYECPYIDSEWNDQRVYRAIEERWPHNHY